MTGNRNVLVQLQENAPTTNSDGQKVQAWNTVGQRWGEVLTRNGRERRAFEQLHAEVEYIVRTNCDPLTRQIKPADWRLTFHDGFEQREMNVAAAIDVDMKHRTIELHCTEIVV